MFLRLSFLLSSLLNSVLYASYQPPTKKQEFDKLPLQDGNLIYDVEENGERFEIGKGCQAKVFRGFIEKDRITHKVALKEYSLGTEEGRRAHEESANLQNLDHPHIVKLLASYESPTHLTLAMPLLGREMFEIVCTWGKFSEDIARRHFASLVDAVSYMHSKRILHRDIKLDNLLIDPVLLNSTTQGSFVISDFGLSKEVYYPNFYAFTQLGTPANCSPEILNCEPYSFGSDWWAMGCLLHVMVVGQYLFEVDQGQERKMRPMQKAFFKKEQLEHVSKNVQDVIWLLMDENQAKRDRLTKEQILKMDFFKTPYQKISI